MIEARDLTKHYGRTLAVDGVSFTLRSGVVTGFLGPNGAGKSTTMRLLLGLDRPDRGRATIDGVRYRDLRFPLRVVGASLEASGAHRGRRAVHHLLALAQSQGLPRRRVDEVLAAVGLAAVARRRVRGLSLGMAQRLGMAAALLGDPPVLILDEPFNGLDPEGVHWVRALMRRLAAEGRTVLVSSHLMNEMAVTADHLLVIGRGRILADCAAADLLARGTRPGVRVRTPDPDRLVDAVRRDGGEVEAAAGGGLRVVGLDAPRVATLAGRAGVLLHELTPEAASLEQTFLELTRDAVEYRPAERTGA
jgi:ABC-2 type transport system ATP-binding protein